MRSNIRASVRALMAAAFAALLALLTVAGAPVAAAHATLMSTDPADGAVLDQAPERVAATFNEPMQDTFAAMTVVGPDGNLWNTGDAEVDGPVISIGVQPLGPAGTYTVNYRATSADGHVVSGSWQFEMSVAGAGAPGQPADSPAEPAGTTDAAADADDSADATSDDSMPVWPFVALAAVIVAGGAIWAVRRQR